MTTDEASDPGLSEYIHKLLDERNLVTVPMAKVAIRQRIHDALVNLKEDADAWERRFEVLNSTLADRRQELTEACTVVAVIHPDGFEAFSKHGHLRACQDAQKLWEAVREKVKISCKTTLEFEVEVKEAK